MPNAQDRGQDSPPPSSPVRSSSPNPPEQKQGDQNNIPVRGSDPHQAAAAPPDQGGPGGQGAAQPLRQSGGQRAGQPLSQSGGQGGPGKSITPPVQGGPGFQGAGQPLRQSGGQGGPGKSVTPPGPGHFSGQGANQPLRQSGLQGMPVTPLNQGNQSAPPTPQRPPKPSGPYQGPQPMQLPPAGKAPRPQNVQGRVQPSPQAPRPQNVQGHGQSSPQASQVKGGVADPRQQPIRQSGGAQQGPATPMQPLPPKQAEAITPKSFASKPPEVVTPKPLPAKPPEAATPMQPLPLKQAEAVAPKSLASKPPEVATPIPDVSSQIQTQGAEPVEIASPPGLRSPQTPDQYGEADAQGDSSDAQDDSRSDSQESGAQNIQNPDAAMLDQAWTAFFDTFLIMVMFSLMAIIWHLLIYLGWLPGKLDFIAVILLFLALVCLGFILGVGWKTFLGPERISVARQLAADLSAEREESQRKDDELSYFNEALSERVEENEQLRKRLNEQSQGQKSGPLPPMPAPRMYDRVLDPPDYDPVTTEHPHSKLYPARAEEQNNLGFEWHIIGASRRGYGHSYSGKYREDDFAIRIFNSPNSPLKLALVAIADGVGSKPYSRYGALAAVQGATWVRQYAEAPLPQGKIDELLSSLQEEEAIEERRRFVYTILRDALRSARLAVAERAEQHEPPLNVDDLHSTLQVFLAVPLDHQRLFIASTQVGDGVLFSLQKDPTSATERWDWLQHAQIQEAGNEVQPFMRSKPDTWEQFFDYRVLQEAIFVMGMTDGTADDIEPPRPTPENPDPDPFFFVDDFYRQHIKKDVLGSLQPAQALEKFLRYQKAQSYDDRTVICLYKKKSQ